MTQCYMCNAEAVSTEHVPPKCIFPEAKDLGDGKDYRRNLITVPSCGDHNLRKSGDDEFLLFVLVSNFDINLVGLKQWATKLRRSMRRRPTKMKLFRNVQPFLYRGVITGLYEIDYERLVRQFDFITRGLYYFHTSKQWTNEVQIVTPATISIGSAESNRYNQTMKEIVEIGKQFLIDQNVHGDNPDIFYYQIKFRDDAPGLVIRMVFYSGIEVLALSNSEPGL